MDLTNFVKEMDRCWIERRIDDLRRYLAPDVVFVAPDGARVEGLGAALQSYQDFMASAVVKRFEGSDYTVTERGDTAVVEYAWDMEWQTGERSSAAQGREVLVLARGNANWRVVWRIQLPPKS